MWRGRRLTGLGKGAPHDHLRPTSDRVRESLFNVIEHGGARHEIDGARVLDIFAGTGALGLEALSRGAAHAVFVDNGRAAGQLIRANLDALGAGDRARLLTRDARRLPTNADTPFDLIFLDPPYGKDLGSAVLRSAFSSGWVAPGALIVWEENQPQQAPEGYAHLETRPYGGTHVTFLKSMAAP